MLKSVEFFVIDLLVTGTVLIEYGFFNIETITGVYKRGVKSLLTLQQFTYL